MSRPIIAIDAETDPFLHGRVPAPFIWGAYDGTTFRTFSTTDDLLLWLMEIKCYAYAHNGGKFDFMFMLPSIAETRVLMINGRIVEMRLGDCILRDSFAIIPTSLKSMGTGKTEIAYWKMEETHRANHMEEIRSYLRADCIALYDAVTAYHEAAGTRSTIASNALAFCRRLGTDPGRTGARFDREFRAYYYGGRVEAFKPGAHSGVKVLDIKSSYPYAMMQEHATGQERSVRVAEDGDCLRGLTPDQIKRAFLELTCFSRGAFPRIDKKGGMSFPHDTDTFRVTGWEYAVAMKHGLLENVRISKVISFHNTINFAGYVNHWYAHKSHAERTGDKVQRLIGKIMMNSLYGKLAQNPRGYHDYEIKPLGTTVDTEHGWFLAFEFGDKEVHARSVLWKHKQGVTDAEFEERPIFHNVATGASITGFARAYLLDAMHTVGIQRVCYVDTDSLLILGELGTGVLRQDNELGAWQYEGTATPCYIAGKKLYGLTFTEGPEAGKTKIASKGARLTLADIKILIEGGTVTWKNDAPSFSVARGANFVVRNIRATAIKP